MFPFRIKTINQLSLIFFVLSYTYGQDRKITSTLNPEGPDDAPEITLAYIRADGARDSVHQIWDFTRGMPTIIYAVTSLNASLQIAWKELLPSKLVMSELPKYSFAAAMDKIYEYNDLKDDAHINTTIPQRGMSFRNFSWRRNDTVLTDKEAKLMMHGRNRDARRPGIVNIKLDFLPFKDYAPELPHLIHTANSTLIDISLVNLTTSPDYNSSRFALHFVLVSTDSWKTNSWSYTMRKSLDDEHTPGVFEIIEIKSPRTAKSRDGGFVQFRPVAYTEPQRGVSSSTNAYVSAINMTTLPSRSTLILYFMNYKQSNVLVQDMYISFGLPGDGFYNKHNYTSWSFTIGYGMPPLEGFSLFVIIIISIGLGVPVLLAVSGVGMVVARRWRQRNPPARLTNEE